MAGIAAVAPQAFYRCTQPHECCWRANRLAVKRTAVWTSSELVDDRFSMCNRFGRDYSAQNIIFDWSGRWCAAYKMKKFFPIATLLMVSQSSFAQTSSRKAVEVLAADGRTIFNGSVRFVPERITIDRSNRLTPATLTFQITNVSKKTLKYVRIVCEFHEANGSYASDNAGLGYGSVSYLDPGQTLEGRVTVLRAPDAVSARCDIDRME